MTTDLEAAETKEWLSRARALKPVMLKYRDQAEADRRVPQPVFEAMREAGFLQAWLPKAYGGYEIGIPAMNTVMAELASYDASSTWSLGVWTTVPGYWGFMAKSALEEALGGRRDFASVISSNPAEARVVRVPGGFRLSGRWPFLSGAHQAEWIGGASLIHGDDGKPVLDEAGKADLRMFFVPRAQAELIDTWYSTGLRGSGSVHFQVDDAFVPEHFQFSLTAATSPHPGILWRGQMMHIAGWEFAAIALGIARDAVDSVNGIVRTKVPARASTVLANQAATHIRFGEAEAQVRSGEAFLQEMARQMMARLAADDLDDRLQALCRLSRAHAAQSAGQAVELMSICAATAAVYEGSRIERCVRDMATIRHHQILSPTNIEMAGQFFVGGELQMRR